MPTQDRVRERMDERVEKLIANLPTLVQAFDRAQLWAVIDALRVGIGETKIVAGSKALHHLLPELVPPIDREYTLRFFYNHKNLNRGDDVTFLELFPRFHRIVLSCAAEIDSLLGARMNTSRTKVVDNAIVGYVRTKRVKAEPS